MRLMYLESLRSHALNTTGTQAEREASGRNKGILPPPPPNVTEFYSTFFQVLLALASFSLRKELKPRTPNPDSKITQGITNNLVPTGSFLSS